MATALQILPVTEMKDQLDIGTVPVDAAFDLTVAGYIESAVSTVDPLVRPSLLDQTIAKTIKQPDAGQPIKLKHVSDVRSHDGEPDYSIKYWLAAEATNNRPIAAPTGVADYGWVDTTGLARVAIWPAAADWPTSATQMYRVQYNVGIAAADVPEPIKQSIILLARRLYKRYETMDRNATWYRLLGPWRKISVGEAT